MYLRLIILFTFSTAGFVSGQNCSSYDVFLTINSEVDDVHVHESENFKSYIFSKLVPSEKFDYFLSINNKGKITKNLKGSNSNKTNYIQLNHFLSTKNYIEVSKILITRNTISFKEFIESEFDSFYHVLKNAENVYIIDLAFQEKENGLYKAIKVIL